MAIVSRGEASAGPVAVDGRTIRLVARTNTVQLGRGSWAAFVQRAAPAHVEVLEADGRRQVLRVHDVERLAMSAIAVLSAAWVFSTRARRARARRGA